jgi:chromosome segregation ATPase
MDKEKLQQRLGRLREEFAQLQSNLQAYHGAIQECEFWLAQIEKDNGPATAD